jgi:hypothetical protein
MNSIVSEKRFIAERLGLPYESLSQSYLRSATTLTNQSQVDFILQANKKTGGVDEKLLQLNDEFVVTHFAVYLSLSEGTGAEAEATTMQYTYVPTGPQSRFSGNSQNSVALYNGDLSWTIDRQEFVPQFPMRAFFRVPDVQEEFQGGSDTNIVSGYNNGLYGFYPSEPTKIDGRQTIDLSVNIGSTVDFAPLGGASVKAVFEARGYLITNANS